MNDEQKQERVQEIMDKQGRKDRTEKTAPFEVRGLMEGYPDLDAIQDEKEIECWELLEKLNIPCQRIVYSKFPETPEEFQKMDEAIETPGIKNLVFSTRNRKRYFFIVLPRNARFDHHAFRNQHHISKLHLCEDADLEELLHTRPGSVSILELIHDTDHKIELYIDPVVLKEPYFRFHPNNNLVTVRISMDDFLHVLVPALNHEMGLLEGTESVNGR